MNQFYILLFFVFIAFYTDFNTHKIPNAITISMMVVGWLFHILVDGFSGMWFSIIGFLAMLLFLLLLYFLGAVAAGDVKFFGAVGALVGLKISIFILVYSILFSGLIGLGVLIFKKENWFRLKAIWFGVFSFVILRNVNMLKTIKSEQYFRFPFMLAVLPAVVVVGYQLLL
ncbi:A24 family peptidase [Chengkuizengella axinellae]|uniref:A24 family peptidase n=1 Tax=Chengkuizengella axinellae TaxID=3064388 RepID=A0ABT9IXL7_9BACL|nr:A24 family peptidase [Chengkuizengella sp. 2205SS18-9]MDP5274102.1 A24 family peptidase [Chengkuizengella sp. 2205SS18-9]